MEIQSLSEHFELLLQVVDMVTDTLQSFVLYPTIFRCDSNLTGDVFPVI